MKKNRMDDMLNEFCADADELFERHFRPSVLKKKNPSIFDNRFKDALSEAVDTEIELFDRTRYDSVDSMTFAMLDIVSAIQICEPMRYLQIMRMICNLANHPAHEEYRIHTENDLMKVIIKEFLMWRYNDTFEEKIKSAPKLLTEN